APENKRHQLAEQPAAAEAQCEAEHQAVENLRPLVEVYAAEAVVDGYSRASESGDKAVALTCGYPQEAGARRVHDDREQRRAQRYQRLLRIAAEVDHVAYRERDGAVDVRHYKDAQEIEDST